MREKAPKTGIPKSGLLHRLSYKFPPPERSQNASASRTRFLIDVASILVPISVPFSWIKVPFSAPLSLI
jgi:hypothetical protein